LVLCWNWAGKSASWPVRTVSVAGNGTFGTCGAPETEPSGAIIEVRVSNNLGPG
jgi:hypothetical protein